MTVKNYLVLYMTFVSFFLWTVSILNSNQNMADFGLVQSLPSLYFISLGILLVSFLLALKWQMSKIKFLIILFLIMYIFLTPALIEGMPRFRSAYTVYGYTDYINRNGYIDPNIIWYHNWPGTFITMSILSDIIDPNYNSLFWMYFPFAIEILYFFPIYFFLKLLFQDQDDKMTWIGVWLFYVLNFINQDYMSPQAFAYLYFLIILLIIVKIAKINRNSDKVSTPRSNLYMLIGILIFSALVITHMMTPMLVISIFLCLALFSKNSVSKRNFYKFTFISVVILTAWTIYGAYTYLKFHLLEFFEKAYNADSIISQNLVQRISGSSAHLVVSKLMTFSALISIIMAIAGIIVSYYYKKEKISSINKNVLLIVFAISVVVPVSSYGGEMIMRVFLFFLPFLSFFIPQTFVNLKMKTVLILFLILMTPMNIITHYGNEKYDHVSKGEFASYDFLNNKIENRYIIGGFPSYSYEYPEKYLTFAHENVMWNNENLSWDGNRYKIENLNYSFMISRGDREQFEIFNNDYTYINDTENNLSNSTDYINVYSNGDTNIFNYRL